MVVTIAVATVRLMGKDLSQMHVISTLKHDNQVPYLQTNQLIISVNFSNESLPADPQTI